MECPQCGKPVWDNREENKKRIAEGQKPRPEFSCKDKDVCGWVKWPAKESKGFIPKPKSNGKSEGERLEIIRQSSLKVAEDHLFHNGIKASKEDLTMLSEYLANYVRWGLKREESEERGDDSGKEHTPEFIKGLEEDNEINLDEVFN